MCFVVLFNMGILAQKIQYLLFGAFCRSFHIRPCTSADTDGIQSVVSQLNGADIIMR